MSKKMIKKTVANIIIITICFSVLPFSACDGEIKNPDTFVIATTTDIATLDPAYAYDTASAGQIQNIYETLIKFDGNSTSEFIPVSYTHLTLPTTPYV